jgi:hypothetical protein
MQITCRSVPTPSVTLSNRDPISGITRSTAASDAFWDGPDPDRDPDPDDVTTSASANAVMVAGRLPPRPATRMKNANQREVQWKQLKL